MQIARQQGLFLLLTSNDLPGQGGYWELSNQGASSQFEGYRNAHILTEPGVDSARRYWGDLLTGLAEHGAPFDAVLGWQLLNEQWLFEDQPPLSLDSGVVTTANGQSYDLADPAQKRRMVSENLIHYIGAVREVILAHDPTALVTMGFFVPGFPNATAIAPGWYRDTASLIAGGAPLDFYDFHAYPGEDITLAQMAENFGMIDFDEKPVILGEYGAFQQRYDSLEAAARAITDWMVESCALGFDGWLYWDFYAAPLSVGDSTWGFADEDFFLMDLISPASQPDPCVAVEVPTSNLAYGKTARASMALPDQPPEQAVDGNGGSQWGAGAHPPQWIEIDLGAPLTVGAIRLLVAQYPDGATVHRVVGRSPDGSTQLLAELSGETHDGDWLEITADAPWESIQFIRVETLNSPSWVGWREIQVFAPKGE